MHDQSLDLSFTPYRMIDQLQRTGKEVKSIQFLFINIVKAA